MGMGATALCGLSFVPGDVGTVLRLCAASAFCFAAFCTALLFVAFHVRRSRLFGICWCLYYFVAMVVYAFLPRVH